MPSDKAKAPKREKPTKAKVKKWLKDKGHKAKDVDNAIDGTANSVLSGMLSLHGITDEQYRAAKPREWMRGWTK